MLDLEVSNHKHLITYSNVNMITHFNETTDIIASCIVGMRLYKLYWYLLLSA